MMAQAGLRWLARLAVLLVLMLGVLLWMFANARAMPVVRHVEVALPWPKGAPTRPLKVALITDTHLSGPDNDPDRMARIVDLVNRQRPDIVLLGGDYQGDRKGGHVYDVTESVAPFARFRAPLGVVAVPGNHDWRWSRKVDFAPARHAMEALGITVLQNEAVRRGPLVIGGFNYGGKGWPNIPKTLSAMDALGGAPILLVHSPEFFPDVPRPVPLMLAGHVHCGQIALPFYGPVYVPTRKARRYSCGVYREKHGTIVVSGGVGTSGLPLRAFAPPDIWIVTVRPR
ncbi:metallophosphoesterase [Sphingobium aquiterrae]|uniref:metallophosphoesterase n=1 Tax=Sphingobium aquiterrae TaxID=2038656 RepID=UPI0030173BCA